ncbi:unnamed protein product [Chondrus crispus]|uniref:Coenzyme Q-binding protein COQ10 START domain-containing protein n=1 Tax=Chondrus crispus TaxID=2769 RepID=R7QCL7_CHOCR|nr:unnamed protein product [Chondrus crispus]CDF35205.1 unnamed protein product [Chondrus crispus]|eukprot:XP_005715024.1 unnamed protein product [Chondrus crispus]
MLCLRPLPAFQSSPLPFKSTRQHGLPSVASRRPSQLKMVASRERSRRAPVAQSNRNGSLPTGRVKVIIEAPAPNRRHISASNLIQAPLEIVWELLSDYDRLADHIPNLALSNLKAHPRNGIRVEQCGSQKILGFEFRASLTMDMTEVNRTSSDWRAIEFDLVSSRDFNKFEGVWRMERVDQNRTALYYNVSIVPRGLVPVRAIEWRISEDVPGNMNAVRTECERRRRNRTAQRLQDDVVQAKRLES